MLVEELDATNIVVEAFDNPNFMGSPASSVLATNFTPERGKYKEVDLKLSPGEYYLRAYLRTGSDRIIPYELGDMELVADTPVGVYGALSGSEKIEVGYEKNMDPLHLFLDQLFVKPGSEPESKARFRIQLSVDDINQVQTRRDIKIGLFKDTDFEEEPKYLFDMASELLLITGEEGKAEFVTPSLAPENYILFIYIDNNGNGFYDTAEPKGLFTLYGEPRYLVAEQNHTKLVRLSLDVENSSTDPEAEPENPEQPEEEEGE